MKHILSIVFLSALLASCNNETPQKTTPVPTEATSILKHKYWVSKPYADALFAPKVMDTLYRMRCAEIMFMEKDTLLMTACMSDAGYGIFKSTGSNSIEILFEGYEKNTLAVLDEKTGILKLTPPENSTYWETEYVAFDNITFNDIDYNNPSVQLARRRMAGSYSLIPKKGQMVTAALAELKEDGQAINFEGFDWFDPLPTGTACSFTEEKEMMMVDFKKGKADVSTVCGVQLRGDTLYVYDSKNTTKDDEMPYYKISGLRATYVKSK
ncbi:MAG: hypothetical protein JNJ57_04995 [Saprospiraceae bacterium]|nr:hypothetical protein [Saprospiraceae bacterium]